MSRIKSLGVFALAGIAGLVTAILLSGSNSTSHHSEFRVNTVVAAKNSSGKVVETVISHAITIPGATIGPDGTVSVARGATVTIPAGSRVVRSGSGGLTLAASGVVHQNAASGRPEALAERALNAPSARSHHPTVIAIPKRFHPPTPPPANPKSAPATPNGGPVPMVVAKAPTPTPVVSVPPASPPVNPVPRPAPIVAPPASNPTRAVGSHGTPESHPQPPDNGGKSGTPVGSRPRPTHRHPVVPSPTLGAPTPTPTPTPAASAPTPTPVSQPAAPTPAVPVQSAPAPVHAAAAPTPAHTAPAPSPTAAATPAPAAPATPAPATPAPAPAATPTPASTPASATQQQAQADAKAAAQAAARNQDAQARHNLATKSGSAKGDIGILGLVLMAMVVAVLGLSQPRLQEPALEGRGRRKTSSDRPAKAPGGDRRGFSAPPRSPQELAEKLAELAASTGEPPRQGPRKPPRAPSS